MFPSLNKEEKEHHPDSDVDEDGDEKPKAERVAKEVSLMKGGLMDLLGTDGELVLNKPGFHWIALQSGNSYSSDMLVSCMQHGTFRVVARPLTCAGGLQTLARLTPAVSELEKTNGDSSDSDNGSSSGSSSNVGGRSSSSNGGGKSSGLETMLYEGTSRVSAGRVATGSDRDYVMYKMEPRSKVWTFVRRLDVQPNMRQAQGIAEIILKRRIFPSGNEGFPSGGSGANSALTLAKTLRLNASWRKEPATSDAQLSVRLKFLLWVSNCSFTD